MRSDLVKPYSWANLPDPAGQDAKNVFVWLASKGVKGSPVTFLIHLVQFPGAEFPVSAIPYVQFVTGGLAGVSTTLDPSPFDLVDLMNSPRSALEQLNRFQNLNLTDNQMGVEYAPPASQPIPPAPLPQPANPIGVQFGAGLFAPTPGDVLPGGSVFVDAHSVMYSKIDVVTPFGHTRYWKQVS